MLNFPDDGISVCLSQLLRMVLNNSFVQHLIKKTSTVEIRGVSYYEVVTGYLQVSFMFNGVSHQNTPINQDNLLVNEILLGVLEVTDSKLQVKQQAKNNGIRTIICYFGLAASVMVLR